MFLLGLGVFCYFRQYLGSSKLTKTSLDTLGRIWAARKIRPKYVSSETIRISCSPICGWLPWLTDWLTEVAQSCPTLCDSMDCSLPGSSVHGILQAIVLEWIAIPFSRGSSRPGDRTWVFRIVDRRFTVCATSEVPHVAYSVNITLWAEVGWSGNWVVKIMNFVIGTFLDSNLSHHPKC